MEREEHLKFCRKCLNRGMDLKQGLICSLTGQLANFSNECPYFDLDENVVIEPLDDYSRISKDEYFSKLSSEKYEQLKLAQNFPAGTLAATIIGISFAILWGYLAFISGLRISLFNVVVGAAVAFGLRIFGKGIDQKFGIAGGVIVLICCLLGNYLSMIGVIANEEGLNYFEVIKTIGISNIPKKIKESFQLFDLFSYWFVVYVGYKYSFRKITEQTIDDLMYGDKK